MNPLQSLRNTARAWNPFAAAEEVSPPPPPPPPSPPTESLQRVSQWIPGISVEETPASSSLPEPLARASEKVQGLLSNAWTSPHFEAFQGFGKKVCEYISPLVSDRAEEICADETNHTLAAVIVTALATAVVAKTVVNAARAFSCRNKDLRECIEAGSLYGVKWRLKSSDVDSISPMFGETELIHASRLGKTAIVRHLLKTADPNIQAGPTGDTALHAAIRAGQNKVVLELLGKADVNKRNAKGQTPIMLAVAVRNDFAIEALAKQRGINWDAQSIGGNTVLHYVAQRKFSQVVLDNADANIANQKGELPLHIAVGNRDFGSNVSALAAKTRDTYAKDQGGKTPFVRALEAKNTYVARNLFDQKKVVTAANSDIVGLALKKGLTPSQLFVGIQPDTLRKIKPEGLDLPTFAAIYGLENCLEYLASKKLYFQGASAVWEDNVSVLKLIRRLLESPEFLSRITTRKYDKDALLRELDIPPPAAASATAAQEPSMEMELLSWDAKHYLKQLEREHSHLPKPKR